MKKLRIGLIAAMPEEVTPLLRRMGVYGKKKLFRQSIFQFRYGGQDLWLTVSGMGPANASAATRLLIDYCSPEIIVNLGFAGSLSPGLTVGDVVLAERLFLLHDRLLSEQPLLATGITENPEGLCIPATFVTTGDIASKKELSGKLPDTASRAIVEMETAAVAKIACAENIPLLAIRAISDGFDEELAFTLDEFCDKGLNLQRWRVMLAVVKNPSMIPQLIRLSRNTKVASEALAAAASEMLSVTYRT